MNYTMYKGQKKYANNPATGSGAMALKEAIKDF